MPNKSYRRFYLIQKNKKQMPLRRWADENRIHFPKYNFTNSQSDFPITHEIANILENKFNCKRVEEQDCVLLVMP